MLACGKIAWLGYRLIIWIVLSLHLIVLTHYSPHWTLRNLLTIKVCLPPVCLVLRWQLYLRPVVVRWPLKNTPMNCLWSYYLCKRSSTFVVHRKDVITLKFIENSFPFDSNLLICWYTYHIFILLNSCSTPSFNIVSLYGVVTFLPLLWSYGQSSTFLQSWTGHRRS